MLFKSKTMTYCSVTVATEVAPEAIKQLGEFEEIWWKFKMYKPKAGENKFY